MRFQKLGFYETASTTGNDLHMLLKKIFEDLGLDAESFLMSQSYDGASNMSGCFKGLATLVQNEIPRAFYIHCYAHKLNLCLQDACSSIKEVRNCIGTAMSLFSFFGASAKRSACFKNIQQWENNSEIATSLKRLCETRWASRSLAFDAIRETYKSILKSLEFIDLNDKTAAGANAKSLLTACNEFEFFFTVTCLSEVFKRTSLLSVSLQTVDLDLAKANNLIKATHASLEDIETDTFFETIYSDCLKFAKENNMNPPKLGRTTTVPARFKDALPAKKNHTNIRAKFHDLFFEVIDHIKAELNCRFREEDYKVAIALTNIIRTPLTAESDIKMLSDLNFYNHLVDFKQLKTELLTWGKCLETIKDSQGIKYDSGKASECLRLFTEKNLSPIFPEILRVFQIYMSIGVTSASAERSFSALKRIKTWLRNSMIQDRLSNLAILHIEKLLTSQINLNDTINLFAASKDRKLIFR